MENFSDYLNNMARKSFCEYSDDYVTQVTPYSHEYSNKTILSKVTRDK